VTEPNRRAAIAQEIQQGRAALRAARALRDLHLYNDALNRLYYALFHHAVALLLIEGVEPRRRAALAGLLGQHVVGRHELSAGDVAVISRTCTFRDLADYERTWNADEGVAHGAFAEVEPLMDRISRYLTRSSWLEDE
jgi:uncharacterized protein (UPF0332 family)